MQVLHRVQIGRKTEGADNDLITLSFWHIPSIPLVSYFMRIRMLLDKIASCEAEACLSMPIQH